ncbi:MAG TPA: hypothetical protein VE567_03995 [Sphingomonas sp.]|nr:hypothetical protein [Sphingomonas sp.]
MIWPLKPQAPTAWTRLFTAPAKALRPNRTAARVGSLLVGGRILCLGRDRAGEHRQWNPPGGHGRFFPPLMCTVYRRALIVTAPQAPLLSIVTFIMFPSGHERQLFPRDAFRSMLDLVRRLARRETVVS